MLKHEIVYIASTHNTSSCVCYGTQRKHKGFPKCDWGLHSQSSEAGPKSVSNIEPAQNIPETTLILYPLYRHTHIDISVKTSSHATHLHKEPQRQ